MASAAEPASHRASGPGVGRGTGRRFGRGSGGAGAASVGRGAASVGDRPAAGQAGRVSAGSGRAPGDEPVGFGDGAPFGADPSRSVRASITQASVERAFAILLAMTAVGLGIVDTPAVLAQLPYLDPFWGPVVAIALGASFVLVGVSAFVPRVAQFAQILCALLFLVALTTWPLTVQDSIPSTQQPWPWWFCTVGSTAAAMGFATWRATIYTALVPAIYVVLRLTPIGGDAGLVRALLDGVYTALLSGAVLVIAVVLRRAASSVDTAQSTAVRRYSLAIREHAVEVERVQVDAIVHDSVLTTLLSAARADTLEAKTLAARMARNAIDHLEAAAADGPDDDTPVTLADLRTRIGEGIGALAAPVRLVAAPAGSVRLPASVADALASAALQAAVNSVQHAGGPDVARWVRVEQHEDGVHVEVGDDGRGFDVATIPSERLGVRRSIIERVAAVDGRAEVHSAPGEGTRIELRWSPTTPSTLQTTGAGA
jgi:signal transduction histidine kinase